MTPPPDMPQPDWRRDGASMYHGDCLAVMAGMPDSCIDLIATDPPYFKVKGEAWDRQWDKPDQFIAWIGQLCEQWQRILKPNGSLYCFASPQMRARVEVKVGRWFNCLPTITWAKGEAYCGGWHAGASKPALRSFFPRTEAIVFAEHYSADNMAKGEAGYVAKCDELRGFVFEPLRAYLAGEWGRSGLVARDANEATGTQMASHYLTRSQWALPTQGNYDKLRRYANENGRKPAPPIEQFHNGTAKYHHAGRVGEYLRADYEDLRADYEDLRRPFSVTADVPYTDVWTFPTVRAYKGKHPCEKPRAMIDHIISASSRPGAVVLDCFAGSGVVVEAAEAAGRYGIGIELGGDYYGRAVERLQGAGGLFAAAG